jgi:hypothetical protein
MVPPPPEAPTEYGRWETMIGSDAAKIKEAGHHPRSNKIELHPDVSNRL